MSAFIDLGIGTHREHSEPAAPFCSVRSAPIMSIQQHNVCVHRPGYRHSSGALRICCSVLFHPERSRMSIQQHDVCILHYRTRHRTTPTSGSLCLSFFEKLPGTISRADIDMVSWGAPRTCCSVLLHPERSRMSIQQRRDYSQNRTRRALLDFDLTLIVLPFGKNE